MQSLPVSNQLDGNPKVGPEFSVKVALSGGEQVEFVDPNMTRAMVALMDMEAVNGGAASHFGGPAAFAEMMSATYGLAFHLAAKNSEQWHQRFHIINDAGHCENGIYALKANYSHAGLSINSLKKFRSIQSPLTGHAEAHLFPEGVYLSNGPLGSSAGQAQGLAAADKMLGNNRITVLAISDGASMEGEAKEAFAAIPGLAQKGQLNPFVMLISDNNTKLSGRISEDCFSMQPSFQALTQLGWKVLTVEKGNDLQQCVSAIEGALASVESQQPIAVWFKTTKGIGTEDTANSSSGGHGFPLKNAAKIRSFVSEIYKQRSFPAAIDQWISDLENAYSEAEKKSKPATTKSVVKQKIQIGIADAMIRKCESGSPILSVTSDLPGSTGVAAFRKKFPQYSFDVGVAESNMISMGAGFSKAGYIPVVDTFAQFGVTKGALPLIMANLSEAPVICVFSHTGFQDAADGASHQALSYFSMTNSIANLHTYSLSCSDEADALMSQAIEEFEKARREGRTPKSYVFFLGRENFPKNYLPDGQSNPYQLGKAQVVHHTDKSISVAIAANGSLLPHAIAAAAHLESEQIGCYVINTSSVSHIDTQTFAGILEKTGGRLVTVEDHQTIGGMGGQIAHQMALKGSELRLKSLGVDHEFGQSAYLADELYQKHGIDSTAIVSAAKELVK